MKAHESATDCPHCGTRNEMASGLSGDEAPVPGDVTLCIGCGHWSVFNEDGTLRKASKDELREYGHSHHMTAVWRAWWMAVGRYRKERLAP
jgi:hypothetical protein